MLFALVGGPSTLSGAPRIEKTIDRDWTFQYFADSTPDLSPASPAFDDHSWPAVAVPHTWSTFETTREVHPFIAAANEKADPFWWDGWGWYRKRIVLDRRFSDRLISLEFDGVQKYSRIFVNGRCAGEHKGGYTSFSVDITPFLHFDTENLIAVLVSNRRDDPFGGIPPMAAGNFEVYGGIYRDVRLVAKHKVHFPFQGSAEYEGGTFVTTPEIPAGRGTVQVQTWVQNSRSEPRKCTLRTSIIDAKGTVVLKLEQKQQIGPGRICKFVQSGLVSKPHLWSPADPYLYRVRSEVLDESSAADAIDSPLGFRWFSWNHEQHKLYLNGQPITLNGTNRHQEYPWLGDAIPKWMHRRDLEDMRLNLGHNFQRTAHYPNDPYVYELSDKLGILTAEEVPNIKDIAFGRDIQLQNVREMIRRDRNHPCIFFWSMGNETNQPADSAWAKQEDTTRLIHLRRGTNGGNYVQTTNDDIGFENLLRCTVRGWHDGDRDFPEGGHPKNGQVTGTEEWQHDVNREEMIRRSRDNLVVFLYADHGADRKYLYAPLLFINPKGWVDAYRNPKYMYYLWEANFSPKPVLFIEPHLWRTKYIGQRKDITVDSNCSTVTLTINGRPFETLQPNRANGHSVVFRGVPVENGTLSADGLYNSLPVHAEIRMPGEPARVSLTASSETIPAGRNGIAVVSATIIDAHGTHVLGANPPLTWHVDGPGKLVGPDRYESNSNSNWSQSGEMYIDTPVSNVIRSGGDTGNIVITVEAPGLASGRVMISSVAPETKNGDGIEEPHLSDEGREPVRRDSRSAVPATTATPHMLGEIDRDYDLSRQAEDSTDYRQTLTSFIKARNPWVDSSSPRFQAFLTHLAAVLERTHGRLIADDYNFLVRQFNNSRFIP